MTGVLRHRPGLVPRILVGAIVVAAVVVIALLVSASKDSYALKLKLANASGLRTGSEVLLGGVKVGQVKTLDMGPHNRVIVTLDIDKKQVTVGRGAHAAIVAANLLGEKYIALKPGSSKQPLPSGTTLALAATKTPTDLDQVVDVLDEPTRARLQVLLRETGTAVAGRRKDVSAILRQIPLSVTAVQKLLHDLRTDNDALAGLVVRSDRFITRVDENGYALARMLDSTSGAATTFSDQAAALRQAVRGAPPLLDSARTNLNQITDATRRLDPVAGQLANATPSLAKVLKDVRPFTAAAVPTLNKGAQVAPTLTKVATRALPTVRSAVPTLQSFSTIAKQAQPLSAWGGLFSHDLFNIFDQWPHAIQYRDGLGQIFNADLYLNPALILNLANKDATASEKRQNLLDIKNPLIAKTIGVLDEQKAARAQARGAGGSDDPGAGARTATPPTTSTQGGGGQQPPPNHPQGLPSLLSPLLGK